MLLSTPEPCPSCLWNRCSCRRGLPRVLPLPASLPRARKVLCPRVAAVSVLVLPPGGGKRVWKAALCVPLFLSFSPRPLPPSHSWNFWNSRASPGTSGRGGPSRRGSVWPEGRFPFFCCLEKNQPRDLFRPPEILMAPSPPYTRVLFTRALGRVRLSERGGSVWCPP